LRSRIKSGHSRLQIRDKSTYSHRQGQTVTGGAECCSFGYRWHTPFQLRFEKDASCERKVSEFSPIML